MNLLYLSVLASATAIDDAQTRNPGFCSFAVHKFNRLVCEGFVSNGHQVIALSTFYQPNVGIGYYRKKESSKGVQYRYIPSLNFRPFRIIWITFYCFCFVFIWGLFGRKNKAVICDVLNVSACLGALTAAKIIGLRCVGIMTDMPGLSVGANNAIKAKDGVPIYAKLNMSYLGKFSHYVFLTEQMNEAVNVNYRPYIIMEGLVDSDAQVPEMSQKYDKTIVLYAGGLHERYGLKLLVDSFIKAEVDNTELWLYGKGPFSEYLLKNYQHNENVVYKGIVSNDDVMTAEQKASLLVNPRPTGEEFTKYSFPSKNMEYMVSGTPVLTTPLPGMPDEYYQHVFLFDQGESVDGYTKVLREVLTMSPEELYSKGEEARNWVLEFKNNVTQTQRIIDLIGMRTKNMDK